MSSHAIHPCGVSTLFDRLRVTAARSRAASAIYRTTTAAPSIVGACSIPRLRPLRANMCNWMSHSLVGFRMGH